MSDTLNANESATIVSPPVITTSQAAVPSAPATSPEATASSSVSEPTVSLTHAQLEEMIEKAVAAGRSNASFSTGAANVVVPRKTSAELPAVGDVVDFEGHKAVVLELLEREVVPGEDPQYVARIGVFTQTYMVDAERVDS